MCARARVQRNDKIQHDDCLSKRSILSTQEANGEHCLWDSFTEKGKYESVSLNKQRFTCKDEGRQKPLQGWAPKHQRTHWACNLEVLEY